MLLHPSLRRLLAVGALAVVATRASGQTSAQTSVPRAAPDTTCPYAACALGIAPVWNGLAVVRGAAGERVATLGFFHARRLPPALFAASDSAAAYAARAVRVRRIASVLTDGGALLLAAGGVRAIAAGRVDGAGRAVLATGAVAFGASIPLQFAADGHLSRAVWWRNAPIAQSTNVSTVWPRASSTSSARSP